jgi:NAD(P)H-dependent FMN reductase
MRILGIGGSLRRDSYNTALLRHAGGLFEAEGAQFTLYTGLRDIPPFDEDQEINAPKQSNACAQQSPKQTASSSSPPSTTRRFRVCSRTRSTGCHGR